MKSFKNILIILALAVLVAPFISSCKKGAEDPAISFKSRDGRIKGTWKLKAIEGTSKNDYYTGSSTVHHYTIDKTTTFDGTKLKITENQTDVATTGTTSVTNKYNTVTEQSYELKVTFEDNTITITEVWGSGTQTVTYITPSSSTTVSTTITGTKTEEETGTWNWADGKKNKTYIFSNIGFDWEVLRLASKELILVDNSSNKMTQNVTRTTNFSSGSVTSTDSNPETQESSYKYTFEKE